MPEIDTASALRDMVGFLSQKQATNQLQSAQSQDVGLATQGQALAGQISQTLGELRNAAPQAVTMEGNLSWFDRNQRRDEMGRTIPININQGLAIGDYARVVWQRRPEERLAVLRKLFPNQVVRLADTGEPIVEVLDKGGTRQDVLVNPPGLSRQDLAEVGSSTPEIAGGIIGSQLGQAGGASLAGPPGAFVGRVLGGAAGAAIGGAFKDVTARKAEGLPVDFKEIEKTRASEAELNALFDVGLSGAAKTLRIASPFAGDKGPLEFNLRKAMDYFKARGETFEATPGELTGNKLLKRIEATEAPQPGASTVLGGIQTRGEQAISRVLNAAVGGHVSPEQLGEDLITKLNRDVTAPVEQAVAQARDALVQKGETELVNTIDAMTGTGAATKAQAGEAVRAEFEAQRVARKGRVDAAYDAVRAIPGGTGKTLPTGPVLQAAQDIFDELPKTTVAKQVPAFDSYGNPIARTKVTQEVLPSSRPEGLATFLADMNKLKGQKMSLDELTKLKNAANDEIARTEAVPGVKDRWFTKIAVAYDKAVEEGAASLGAKAGNTDLADALRNAKDTYKRELLPLDQEGLHDIGRTVLESGYQAPEQLVNRLFSGGRAEHNYRALQETLGANSAAFAKVKRSLMDSWMLDASDPLTGRVDPGALEKALTSLRGAHPEIYQDLVGGQEKQLFQITRSLKAAGQEIKDLDPGELSQLLRTGNVTRANVIALANAQRVRDTTFANSVLAQLKNDGKLDPDVSPVKFVRSLFNTDIPTDQVKEVLAKLSTLDQEKLQTATLYRILSNASEFKSDYAPAYVAGLQGPVSAKGLAKALGDAGSLERSRNELLLGSSHQELVENAINALAPREVKTGLFKAAGGMAATGTIEKLLKSPFAYAGSFARKFLIATLYTSAPMQKLMMNEAFGPKETAALANLLVASEPFVRKSVEVLGEDSAYSVTKDLKSSIDRFIRQDVVTPQGQAQLEELRQFLQTGKGKVKMEAKP